MNDCLVTKLKATVSNSKLLRLGELRISKPASDDVGQLTIGGTYDVIENTAGWDRQTHIFSGSSAGIVAVSPKYTVNSLRLHDLGKGLKIENRPNDLFNYVPLNTFKGSFADGWDLSEIQGTPVKNTLTTFATEADYVNVRGNVSAISDFSLLTQVNLNYCSLINGSITSFAAMLSLSQLYLATTHIQGSLESLAEAQVSRGRTSGSISVRCNGVLTLEGNIIANGTYKTITFDPSAQGGYTIA